MDGAGKDERGNAQGNDDKEQLADLDDASLFPPVDEDAAEQAEPKAGHAVGRSYDAEKFGVACEVIDIEPLCKGHHLHGAHRQQRANPEVAKLCDPQ